MQSSVSPLACRELTRGSINADLTADKTAHEPFTECLYCTRHCAKFYHPILTINPDMGTYSIEGETKRRKVKEYAQSYTAKELSN